jgi:hypothetical protein
VETVCLTSGLRPSAPKFDLQRTFNNLTGVGWRLSPLKEPRGNLIVGLTGVVHASDLEGAVVHCAVADRVALAESAGRARTARRI